MARKLMAVPVTLTQARAFVDEHHRHNRAPVGGLFAVGLADRDDPYLCGVAIVGRPVARHMQDGWTAEITRVCTMPTAPLGACSFLYGSCWRAARALGWARLITYTLRSESGASLRGAGWRVVAELPGRTPKRIADQARQREWQPVYAEPKLRWESPAA